MTDNAGYRHTEGTHEVVWQPGDARAAVDALVAVSGAGVSSEAELPDDGLVDLTDQPDIQQAVREKHDELTSAKTGGQTSGQ